ncbi:hypothetical protein ASE63_09955 [Bosea sp. Root381]|uniref:hypothetical protein n=1 Tax=Bosea sp. Root381 TaxID=1736524 RepID=UPI0006F5596F|nr:hypothetical protein [Bosea sp. Root381]KRE00376.1 hypothetical protein ASE63_09955 [Bosea sp. Root381]
MTRALVIACLSAGLLLPAGAEAAKMRSGGKSSASSSSETSGGKRGAIAVLPGAAAASRGAKAGDAPARVPFPPSTMAAAAPAASVLAVSDTPKIWCRSEVVVGGFCVLN